MAKLFQKDPMITSGCARINIPIICFDAYELKINKYISKYQGS